MRGPGSCLGRVSARRPFGFYIGYYRCYPALGFGCTARPFQSWNGIQRASSENSSRSSVLKVLGDQFVQLPQDLRVIPFCDFAGNLALSNGVALAAPNEEIRLAYDLDRHAAELCLCPEHGLVDYRVTFAGGLSG